MVLGKLDSHRHKHEVRFLSYAIYKINSTWFKDLNVRPKTNVTFPPSSSRTS